MAPEPPKAVERVTFWSMMGLALAVQIFGPPLLLPQPAEAPTLALTVLGVLVGGLSAVLSVLVLRWAWWLVWLIAKGRQG
jgi:hypothetical protein